MALQHFGLEGPVLEDLRRELDEILEHARAGQPLVRDLREQPVQPVTEFVEERSRVVGGEQRRLARRRLGEVVVVDDDGKRFASHARLRAVIVHPRAAALGRAREIVAQEDPDQPIAATAHLERAHVAMIAADVRAFDEGQAEKPLCGVERRSKHAVQRKVRLHGRLVEPVPRLAHLLRVVAPIPGLDRVRFPVRDRHRRERIALGRGTRFGRLPHLAEELRDRAGVAGHPVDQRVVGVALVSVQPRLLVAQREDFAGDRTVVVLAGVLSAMDPCIERLLAQIAPVGVASGTARSASVTA